MISRNMAKVMIIDVADSARRAWVRATRTALYLSLVIGGILATIPSNDARAQSCHLDFLVGGVEFTYVQFGRPIVPVTLNGQTRFMLYDSGGVQESMERALAEELGLRLLDSSTAARSMAIVDVAGNVSSQVVRVEETKIGNLVFRDMIYFINPGEPRELGEYEVAGVLVPSTLKEYDVELDFGNNLLLVFSHDRCDAPVVHWAADGMAVIPFDLNDSLHIEFPVTVDGEELNAILDTGAANTTMNLRVARRVLDIDVDSPDVEEVGTLEGGYDAAVYRRQFSTLEFGGVTIADPSIILLPDMMARAGSRFELGSQISTRDEDAGLPEVILGMSELRQFHLYIAYEERNLYITAATPAAQ